MTQKIVQAYQQAPWRIRVQRIAAVLLVVVLIGITSGVYLYISSQSAEAGLMIWEYEKEIKSSKSRITELQTELAELTSYSRMEAKAQEMGFHRIAKGEAKFILVPGFYGREIARLSEGNPMRSGEQIVIRPAYTQSLSEWLYQKYTEVLNEDQIMVEGARE